jgi:hypothetical protein
MGQPGLLHLIDNCQFDTSSTVRPESPLASILNLITVLLILHVFILPVERTRYKSCSNRRRCPCYELSFAAKLVFHAVHRYWYLGKDDWHTNSHRHMNGTRCNLNMIDSLRRVNLCTLHCQPTDIQNQLNCTSRQFLYCRITQTQTANRGICPFFTDSYDIFLQRTVNHQEKRVGLEGEAGI